MYNGSPVLLRSSVDLGRYRFRVRVPGPRWTAGNPNRRCWARLAHTRCPLRRTVVQGRMLRRQRPAWPRLVTATLTWVSGQRPRRRHIRVPQQRRLSGRRGTFRWRIWMKRRTGSGTASGARSTYPRIPDLPDITSPQQLLPARQHWQVTETHPQPMRRRSGPRFRKR